VLIAEVSNEIYSINIQHSIWNLPFPSCPKFFSNNMRDMCW